MLVNVEQGTVTLADDNGIIETLSYEPLTDADMVLQAKYHLFLRSNGYRREFVCTRCREKMTSDTNANEGDQTWEMLTRCNCRAMWGKIALKRLESAMRT